jgi:hypothetical protein
MPEKNDVIASAPIGKPQFELPIRRILSLVLALPFFFRDSGGAILRLNQIIYLNSPRIDRRQ